MVLVHLNVLLQLIHGHTFPGIYLFRIRRNNTGMVSYKNMVKFVLDKTIAKFMTVYKIKNLSEFGIKTHFFLKPSVRSHFNLFSRAWVTATRVCPQPWRMVLIYCPLQKEERVILVDSLDQQTGVLGKMDAHIRGVLHRAFSVFVFDDKGNLILMQRPE